MLSTDGHSTTVRVDSDLSGDGALALLGGARTPLAG